MAGVVVAAFEDDDGAGAEDDGGLDEGVSEEEEGDEESDEGRGVFVVRGDTGAEDAGRGDGNDDLYYNERPS